FLLRLTFFVSLFVSAIATPDLYTLSLHDALPILNLASRLTDLAAPREILMDDVSAAVLEGLPAGREFDFVHRAVADVQGLGEVRDRKSTRLELQSRFDLVCRLLLEKKKQNNQYKL